MCWVSFPNIYKYSPRRKGWECPKCGSVLAPWQPFCPFCYKQNIEHNFNNKDLSDKIEKILEKMEKNGDKEK